MKTVRKFLMAAICAAGIFSSGAARAGVPVIDVANLVESVLQVLSWMQQYDQMVASIKSEESQLKSLTGARGLGNILNNPLLQQVIPKETAMIYNGVTAGGYAGLNAAAIGIRNGLKKYNCEGRMGDAYTTCSAVLNNNSQTQGFQTPALQTVADRVAQIQSLQDQIDGTEDPKAIAELQARLTAELAQVGNDNNRINLMQGMGASSQLAAEQRQRERWLAVMTPATPATADTFVYAPPSP